MGLLFWRRSKTPKPEEEEEVKPKEDAASSSSSSAYRGAAMEVPRPTETSVFEFGKAEGLTMAGYCPVSNDLEPCRWQILPTGDPKAPRFRVVF